MEPPMSLPSSSGVKPAASAAADPPGGTGIDTSIVDPSILVAHPCHVANIIGRRDYLTIDAFGLNEPIASQRS